MKKSIPTPEFDDVRAWGFYAPSGTLALRLAVMHQLPSLLAPFGKLLRRPIKYKLTTPLDLEIWGLKLRLLPRGNMSEQKILTAPHLFDKEELLAIERHLSPGSVFVDVGANAGIYSFWANRCMAGTGRILAFEPDPEMLRRLKFNIKMNFIEAITIMPFAVSDHEGIANLQVNPAQRGTNTLEESEVVREGGVRQALAVKVMPLLRGLELSKIVKIDVLKLDIEGHEPVAMRHFFSNAPASMLPGAVITEYKPETERDIIDLMSSYGYTSRKTTKLNYIFERN